MTVITPSVRRVWANGRWEILITAVVCCVVFAIGVTIYAHSQPGPFDPLQYPSAPQTVLGETEQVTVGGAMSSVVVLRYNGRDPVEFRVTASKCNNSSEAVRKRSHRYYSSVSPRGSDIVDVDSFTLMIPGCTTRTIADPFVNVVPKTVLDRAVELSRSGGGNVTLWQLKGEEVPLDGNGNSGVSAFWQTDTFGIRIVP